MVMIALLVVTLGVDVSSGQDLSRLRYVPTADDIAEFFQGELSSDIERPLGAGYIRYLHLMGEVPLPGGTSPQASELHRVLIETRP
jgi:hypothetical protein